MHHIAIFASGSGSNAQQITEYFRTHPDIRVRLILCNNPEAYVLKRADNMGIPSYLFNREEFYTSETVLKVLQDYEISFLVLAGFLWLVPDYLLKGYPGRIINIHPALLPKFGGKGMYGEKVHQAVIRSGEKRTGISIHYVNERYDEGDIIFQASFKIMPDDTPESIAEKVHALEYRHFPGVIEEVLKKKI
ncbi:MAG: phosphoribosylglycinamide formyltransferase [Bacteroidales bacterium]|nr:phosphoribosylglycinamide formyltransferase [Bacteroidales bacterium]